MTDTQFWQVTAGLVATLLAMVGVLVSVLWQKLNNWVRDHERRIQELETNQLKRTDFDGGMATLRTQFGSLDSRLTELETEQRIRSEYVEKQLQRLEESQLRIEGMLTTRLSKSRQK